MKHFLVVIGLLVFTFQGYASECRLKTIGGTVLSVNGLDGKYGLSISTDGQTWLRQPLPLQIAVIGSADDSMVVRTYQAPYSRIRCKGKGLYASGEIVTDGGNRFRVEDTYTLTDDSAFVVNRHVSVMEVLAPSERGFSSSYSLEWVDATRPKTDFEYFIPSILYRDTTAVRPGSIASSWEGGQMYVKETRTGLPLAMLREKRTGRMVTLLHHTPVLSTGHLAGGESGTVSDLLQFGSLGYTHYPRLAVGYTYPSREGPRTYEPRPRGVRRPSSSFSARYHEVRPEGGHHYLLAILPDKSEDYQQALVQSFSAAYLVENPSVCYMNLDSIYQYNIDILKSEWRVFGNGSVKAAGLPWSLALPDGRNTEGVSYQMGFVGQQISVGFHLYRYGTLYNEPDTREKGRLMLDFWTSDAVCSTYFPTVWWDPANDERGGRRREYPTFLRCMVDGMEGLLDACRFAEAQGQRNERWYRVLIKVADNLVVVQNADGSFCRAYRTDGSVETGGDRNTFGASKLNTPVAVRFLARMFHYTGDEKYRASALRAAEYSYCELYSGLGKYVGGTPDNPNTVDKEAAIFALYSFNAAHDLTGDDRYLQAAEHAAVSAMSWTYCYDFPLPHHHSLDFSRNPFAQGGIIGFSIIATGHSGADNFISYIYYEMYRLYEKTRNPLYFRMAHFLQNNTKLCTDYDGRMGYKYRAFMPEATNVADWAFRSVSLWLPWSTIANIEPIIKMEERYGVRDVTQCILRP